MNSSDPTDEPYAIERVKDRLWVVIDKTRQGPPHAKAAHRGADDAGVFLRRKPRERLVGQQLHIGVTQNLFQIVR